MAVHTRNQRGAEQTIEFTLLLEGDEPLAPEHLDAWFQTGCDDATFGEVDGAAYADFARSAPAGPEAILSAIEQIERAVRSVRVIRVEPDDLVTASEIASRLGRSRESVRLLIAAERGPGRFPAPASHTKARGRLWRWSEVAGWAKEALHVEPSGDEMAIFVAAINDALDLRRLTPHLRSHDWLKPVTKLLPV